MSWGPIRHLLAWCVAALFALASHPAAAEDGVQAGCHGYSDQMLSAAEALRTVEWVCANDGWEDGRAVAWLRFEAWDKAQPPLVFSTRNTVFESALIATVDAQGKIHQDLLGSDEAVAVKAGPVFVLPLPDIDDDTRMVLVGIERPHSVTAISEAALFRDREAASGALGAMLLLAVVAGMLIMPLLFDSLFWFVLRERFVLLHAAMAISMIVYVLTSGGVLTAFLTIPVSLLAVIGPLAWAFGVGFAGLFAVQFLEPWALSPWVRKALTLTAWWVIIVPGAAALQLDATQTFDNRLYFYAMAPAIPLYFATLIDAVMRGSRAGRFLAAAWLPVILASLDRFLRGIGLYTASDSVDLSLFMALAFEVTVVALAVADRFLAIRRERDHALTEARMLEDLTERDPLTGLLNRRAIESRFAVLRAEGFTAMALVDLDYFKSVNDRHGHAVGDMVLRSVGRALSGGSGDMLAFRMGGEEFLILLRGRNALERAENLRRSIADCVTENSALDIRVTASMGIVDAPVEALPHATFETLYEQADRLLYEAKASGRDRTMGERLKVFRTRRADRRAAAAA